MEIHLKSLLQGARESTGTVVIIDVYRAFTTAAVAFQRGAEKIIFVARIQDGLALRIDSVPFAINVTPEDGLLVARPEPV